ncbi:hypothetical protein CI105_04575 [Candidatus Izimaplasma bacterium ZiA1]|uniref:hypothetical protein n=1 Tax=Candidatus Izimoplasma sp. ZiA1 TaxID=2024899 RepID=UPI000BAA83B1|nr:hypothetical protein CI105_04575 [Candidatus Izimaplasma bacterium ZiA1]
MNWKKNKRICKIIKTTLKIDLLILILSLQLLTFISHQRMINSNIHRINVFESEIRVLMYDEGNNVDAIRDYNTSINALKFDNMPKERILGYLEVSFFVYPLILTIYLNKYVELKFIKKEKSKELRNRRHVRVSRGENHG